MRRSAVMTAKGSGIPVGAEMEVGNDGEERGSTQMNYSRG